MKIATTTTDSGEIVAVTADGKRLGDGDVDCRLLHILPKFFAPVDALPHLDKDCVELSITCTFGDVTPPGGLMVRQPYPNQRYFVGGSCNMRNGWVVPLPEGISQFDLQFDWCFPRAWRWIASDDWLVSHLIHVTLLPGDKRVYTMDANCWPRHVDVSVSGRTPVSLAGHPRDSDTSLEGRDIVRTTGLHYPEYPDEIVGHYIEERVTIPPIAYEKAWTLTAFEEEQLHEVRQTVSFDDGNNATHRQNASLEMPASVFLDAVKLAGEVPFDKDSAFAKSVEGQPGRCESHPAIKILSQWWAENRLDGGTTKVGFAMPWVRARDDYEYWCGYYEVPNVALSAFVDCKPAAARIGDLVLVLFHSSWEHFTYDKHGTSIYLADGQFFNVVGVDKEEITSGDYDEAWYALKALASFPERFSVAHKALQDLEK